MILKDVYDQLAYGELAHLVTGAGTIGSTTEGVPNDQYKKIIPFVKSGLTELHRRFSLRKDEINVTLQTGQSVYTLHLDYAAANTKSNKTPKIIADTEADPFKDDLMQVERVYGTYQGGGYDIPLNDKSKPGAIRTSAFNVLVLPTDTTKAPWLMETSTLRVVYRADHPAIKDYEANSIPERTVLHISSIYLDALVWYVASRLTNAKGVTQEFHEGNNYWSKFEAAVQSIKDESPEFIELDESDKFDRRGFA